ncbi:MAG: hypothetical protein ACXWAT_12400 [Methylobacter sp.]
MFWVIGLALDKIRRCAAERFCCYMTRHPGKNYRDDGLRQYSFQQIQIFAEELCN